MWTAEIISKTISKGFILITVSYSNTQETFEENYSFQTMTPTTHLEIIKAKLDQLNQLNINSASIVIGEITQEMLDQVTE